MADSVTIQAQIPEEKLAGLQDDIAKLNRRAAKLSVPGLEISVGSFRDVGYVKGGKRANDGAAPDYYVRFYDVTVIGQQISLDGWEFVATLQHMSDDNGAAVNLVKTKPGFQGVLPVHFRTAVSSNCDHCHKAISTRKETFALRHENGEWKQIGRSCLQDFLGGRSVAGLVANAEMLIGLSDLLSSAREPGEGGSDYFGLEEFLRTVAACVRVDGWLSRGKAREMEMQATADQALGLLFPPLQPDAAFRAYARERLPTADDRATVEKTIAYIREILGSKAELNDYEHNLLVACSQVAINWKVAGIAGSAIPFYLRAMEADRLRSIELRRAADSKHVGAIGERLILDVQCVKRIELETHFGRSVLHKLIDASGNALVWFASNGVELKVGEAYTLKATVTKHETRDNVAQTVINRAVTLEPDVAAKERAKLARKAAKAAKAAETT
jgi:hypothetical protein